MYADDLRKGVETLVETLVPNLQIGNHVCETLFREPSMARYVSRFLSAPSLVRQTERSESEIRRHLRSQSGDWERARKDLVCRNTITIVLQRLRWSRVGLPIDATASWSAGSPLPLSQAGQSLAYGRYPSPSELSGSLRQRVLRLEWMPDVARRTAKAVEDYPHSKTLARLPNPFRFFAPLR